jgi:hypothetical protein
MRYFNEHKTKKCRANPKHTFREIKLCEERRQAGDNIPCPKDQWVNMDNVMKTTSITVMASSIIAAPEAPPAPAERIEWQGETEKHGSRACRVLLQTAFVIMESKHQIAFVMYYKSSFFGSVLTGDSNFSNLGRVEPVGSYAHCRNRRVAAFLFRFPLFRTRDRRGVVRSNEQSERARQR